jgi:hypothetical protein
MTEKKAAANRRNALKSTGPKTPGGKVKVSMNALKHGLRASGMAVEPLERPEDWEAHRAQVIRDLAPVGYMETVLAERAAAMLWRLDRVVRFEALAITSGMETVKNYNISGLEFSSRPAMEDLLEALQMAQGLAQLLHALPAMKAGEKIERRTAWIIVETAAKENGIDLEEDDPEDENLTLYSIDLSEIPDDMAAEDWNGWTAGYLRTILERLAKEGEITPKELTRITAEALDVSVQACRKKLEEEEASLERARRSRLLLDEKTLDKVSRYETTLERSFFRVLHELQRFQANRGGATLPPPQAVDIDVNLSEGL